ncbi:MAG: sigma-70 family RNA polymerase sigma factor [Aristaeellaceae bacterium]
MISFSFFAIPTSTESTEERLTRLMQAHGDSVLRICYLYLKDHALAQDAAQTTFVKAWQALHTLRDDAMEKAWLMRIAVNTCKSILRSREYRLYAQSPDMEELPEPSQEDSLPDATVLNAVLSLPEKYREVIMLHYYQGLSSPVIAKVLKLPQATILTRLHRARKLLASQLKGWYMDDE